MSNIRQRAIALKAADARAVIGSTFPFVLSNMTAAQLQLVQKVFDAAVINPVIKKESDDLHRKSIIAQSGAYANINPDIARRANQLAATMIHITERDKRVRLNHDPLLTAEALKPTTDNPDELAYLNRIRSILNARGVWLRIGRAFDSANHHYSTDPRKWEVWLSLGEDGDNIPTEDGKLTRVTLLGTTTLGAGYYEQVLLGNVQTTLKRGLNRVNEQYEIGLAQHDRLIKRKEDATFGVAEVSDFVGGADLPSRSIWDSPHKAYMKALEMGVNGDVSPVVPYLVLAALEVGVNAKLLADYVNASIKGAGRAVVFLGVLKTAGEIADTILTVTGVAAIVRGVVRSGAKKAATTVAKGTPKNISPAAYQPTHYYGPSSFNKTAPQKINSPAAKHPTNYPAPEAYNKTVNQANQTAPASGEVVGPMHRSDILNDAARARLLANVESANKETRAWLRANQDASLPEKLAAHERISRKWDIWFVD